MIFTPADLQPFFIELNRNGIAEVCEVYPSCKSNTLQYYDVIINKQYHFTITPFTNDDNSISWKTSFKNADKVFDNDLVSFVGNGIEKHYRYM